MRPADFLRDAVQNEQRIHQAAAKAVAREIARRGEAARRLHQLVEADPSFAAAHLGTDVARLGRGARPITAADAIGDAPHARSRLPGPTSRKDRP